MIQAQATSSWQSWTWGRARGHTDSGPVNLEVSRADDGSATVRVVIGDDPNESSLVSLSMDSEAATALVAALGGAS